MATMQEAASPAADPALRGDPIPGRALATFGAFGNDLGSPWN